MNAGVLDQILARLDVFLVTALPFLRPDVFYLFNSFIVLTIVFAGVWLAFGVPTQNMQFFIKKVLLLGFFSFLVTNWLNITGVILQTFVTLGLKAAAAGGAGITVSQFLSPSTIVNMGSSIGRSLFGQVNGFAETFEFIVMNSGTVVLTLIAGLIVVLSFLIIALQVMMALVEFKLVTLAGFLLLPFALFNKTSFMAERLLGYVFAASVKIFVLAIVITFIFLIIPVMAVGTEPNVEEAIAAMGVSLFVLALSLAGPKAASALISGGPSLGASDVVGAAATGAGAVAAGGLAAGGLAGATGKAGREARLAASRAAARMDNNLPRSNSQAGGLVGAASNSSPSKNSPSNQNSNGPKSSANPTSGKNRGRFASAGRAAANAAPRNGEGGGAYSVDLKGE